MSSDRPTGNEPRSIANPKIAKISGSISSIAAT
jgi:hypothetical protein